MDSVDSVSNSDLYDWRDDSSEINEPGEINQGIQKGSELWLVLHH